MFNSLKYLGVLLFVAGCAETYEDETVICWTEQVTDAVPLNKYYVAPETICVPIKNVRRLPASILDRSVVRGRGGDTPYRNSSEVDVSVTGDAVGPHEQFSEITESGPVAGQRDSSGKTEYSSINRDTGEVRAVDGDIESNLNQVQDLRDDIFRDAGLM